MEPIEFANVGVQSFGMRTQRLLVVTVFEFEMVLAELRILAI